MSQIDPGHSHANTKHISFKFFQQNNSPAPYGYEYYVSLPPSYDVDAAQSFPLLLFLHGAGESQLEPHQSYVSIRHGVPKIILCYDLLRGGMDPPHISIPRPPRARANRREGTDAPPDQSSDPVPRAVCEFVAEKFITVTPSLSIKGNGGYGWNADVLGALVDEVCELYRVDTKRVHVTGFSMGGFGTWKLGLKDPDRFASLVPVCGGGDEALAKNLKHVPQWVHHGEKDDIVPISQSIYMVNALKKAGADEVRFTRYPDAYHDSWTPAYNNIEVFEWIMQKTTEGRQV